MSNTKYIVHAKYIGSGIRIQASFSRMARTKAQISEGAIMDHKIKFRIDEILKQREQSLYWLSRATGVSYTTLWRLTKDRALGMNFATLEKL